MVGYDPNKEPLSDRDHMVAGATSGVVTRVLSQPLDVLKVRFQLQVEPISKECNSKYHGILQAASQILKEEGVTAFWKGHVPAQMLSVVYGVVQFGSYEMMTKAAYLWRPALFNKEVRPITHFACGGLSGCAATLTAQPFDVIRTRLVAQGEPKVYRSVVHASHCMWHQEGFHAFYRGLAPTLLQIIPQTGFQFMFYSLFLLIWNSFKEKQSNTVGTLQSLICGSGAGLTAKLAVYPLDLAKKRLQVLGFEKGRASFGKTLQCRGFVECMRKTAADEGMRALYKGLSPSVLKATLTAGCSFCMYEKSCSLLLYWHHKR